MMSKFEEFFLCQQAEAGKAIVDIAEYLLERCDRVKEMHQPTQGIIPADAGNGQQHEQASYAPWNYPR